MTFRKLPLGIAIIAAMAGARSASAVPELEHNNTFDTRQFVAADSVAGELGEFVAEAFDGAEGGFDGLEGGDVDFFSFTGLTAGEFFVADVTPEGYFDGAEGGDQVSGILLGALDANGEAEALSTNAFTTQPLRLGGIVPLGGELNLAVTGLGDSDFIGRHFEGLQRRDNDGYVVNLTTFNIGDADAALLDGLVELPDASVDGGFFFDNVGVEEGQVVNFDPEVATGYHYAIREGDPRFQSVRLPRIGSDTTYELLVNGMRYIVAAGEVFDFAPGVAEFEVLGIDPAAALDPNNPTAFVTALTFDRQGFVDMVQTPRTQGIASVPEPTTIGLLGLGLLGAWRSARRRLG